MEPAILTPDLAWAAPDRWLATLRDRTAAGWLWGIEAEALLRATEERAAALARSGCGGTQRRILLLESEPLPFLAGFFAAVAQGCSVFLGNAQWSVAERFQVLTWLQPDRLWENQGETILDQPPGDRASLPPTAEPWIGLPTGGTSGQIRFALHQPRSLAASVAGFCAYFAEDWPGPQTHSTLCTLPLCHASGLMQVLRCFWGGGRLALAPIAQGLRLGSIGFLSLVPTQLLRLLGPETPWLQQFRVILLGGAPAWPALLDQAQAVGVRLAPTYGSTETASQVATLRPAEFLAGARGAGQVLPHATVAIESDWAHDPLGNSSTLGRVAIAGNSLAAGYLSAPGFTPLDTTATGQFLTDDLGYFDGAQRLHLVGRASHKIITGGENVYPAEVEAALWETGWVVDVVVLGLPDREWGQAIGAAYVPVSALITPDQLRSALGDRLSRYKIPKRWLPLTQIPRNAQGKVDRLALTAQFRPFG
ncbi:AMP-binding protein [Limnothrix sp. FACHB-881]|uniref:AMP-binding protein n=1 Tax=Limnothrix sp. FACHB-881 TaxID=2692819 RepID=UPI0016895771|nr:AMP-binding protein [Limnothrix sp. FACHB-881]MBD2636715.1 AMP-binding protein [Limnothrix sp. FACHB-881]